MFSQYSKVDNDLSHLTGTRYKTSDINTEWNTINIAKYNIKIVIEREEKERGGQTNDWYEETQRFSILSLGS